jgi:hypothetical protein
MTEPTTTITEIHVQDGYGAHKRGEHCSVCYDTTHRVGVRKVVYSDGTVKYFCAEHVPAPAA